MGKQSGLSRAIEKVKADIAVQQRVLEALLAATWMEKPPAVRVRKPAAVTTEAK